MLSKNKRFLGGVQGLSAGAQAGTLTGAYDSLVRETAGEAEFITSVISNAILGGAFGSVTGPVGISLKELEADYLKRFSDADESMNYKDTDFDAESPSTPFGSEPDVEPDAEFGAKAPTEPTGETPVTSVRRPIVKETTITPDEVDGVANQKRPCMRE
jgi:hypothetical protein